MIEVQVSVLILMNFFSFFLGVAVTLAAIRPRRK